jgi:hypothetical protein
MSDLSIHGLTVSVDFGDKVYGSGNGRFMSASKKVADDHPGISPDLAMKDGIELYFTAWQTMMQTRYATGDIDSEAYKTQTAAFLVRIEQIGKLYSKIKNKSTEELEAFLKAKENHV